MATKLIRTIGLDACNGGVSLCPAVHGLGPNAWKQRYTQTFSNNVKSMHKSMTSRKTAATKLLQHAPLCICMQSCTLSSHCSNQQKQPPASCPLPFMLL